MEMKEPTPEAAFYSPDQQKTIRQGLRILVRIAVRAHVQRPSPVPRPALPGAGNGGRGPGMSALQSTTLRVKNPGMNETDP